MAVHLLDESFHQQLGSRSAVSPCWTQGVTTHRLMTLGQMRADTFNVGEFYSLCFKTKASNLKKKKGFKLETGSAYFKE